MDTSCNNNNLQSPSIESFSYSWLANFKPSPFDDPWIDEASNFIEMDPRLPPSKRFIRVSSDFGFDFPVSDSPLGLVHADELISDGLIVPLFVRDVKIDRHDVNDHFTSSLGESSNKSVVHFSGRVVPVSLRRRCRRLSKRLFYKYLKFLLRPLFYRRRLSRRLETSSSSNSNNNIAGKWEISAATSPRTSLAYSAGDNWRRSCDSDSSIYEAVLHCKRTQSK